MSKTFSEVVEALKDYIQFLRSDADVSTGSVLRDVVIDPVADQVSTLSSDVDTAALLFSLTNASTMTEQELDDFAVNWNLTRLGGTFAVGEVTFQSTSVPTSDITIGNADGSGGVAIRTRAGSDGNSYIFNTTETVYLRTTDTPNPDTGYYEVTAEIEAAIIGVNYNVAANTIVELTSSITGIDYVTNKLAISGGTDKESNTSFANRILTKVTGIHTGTKSGYETLINENITGLSDVNVVGPDDVEMTRNLYGGSVDIYLLGQNIQAASQSEVYDGNDITLDIKPGLTITSVQGLSVVAGNQWTFRKDVDYTFELDQSSTYGYSTESVDRLSWLSGVRPITGGTVTIAHTYDKNVVDAQALVELDENRLITADVLVKYGQEVGVVIEMTINKLSGYDTTIVHDNVVTAVSTLIDNLKLGETLQYSDAIAAAANATGVDEVGVPFIKFYKIPDPKADYYIQNIVPTNTQYLRTDTLTVTVT